MIKHGPIDVLVFALGAPKFDGSIIRELQKQSQSGVIRVLDVMVLFKSPEGEAYRLDIEDLSPADLEALKFTSTDTMGLFDTEDAETFWEGMVPDSGIIALAIEHVWAIDLVNTLADSGVEVAINYRVPAVIASEAFASLEANK